VDEEVARDFLLFGQPDATIVVVDATILERNLNLVLQVLEITDKAVVCLNLIDEAKRKGIEVDHRSLAKELGVPVVPAVARKGEGLQQLIQTVADVIKGTVKTNPHRIAISPHLREAVEEIVPMLMEVFPDLRNPRWVAMRLLDGDIKVRKAVETKRWDIFSGESVFEKLDHVVSGVAQ
jgi:ferrous iron transport protein B